MFNDALTEPKFAGMTVFCYSKFAGMTGKWLHKKRGNHRQNAK